MPIGTGTRKRLIPIAFTVIASLASAASAIAQAQAVYHFRSDGQVDGVTLKHVVENLKGLDQRAVISADADYLKVRIDAAIPYEILLRAMNAGPRQFQAATTATGVQGFPTRMDTGDPAGDDQRYAAAKQAWIAAHPGEYQGMIGVSPSR